MSGEIYRQVDRAYAHKVNDVPRTSAIRLYCERNKQCWGLQVRGPMKLNSKGREGHDFIVAHASLNLEDLKALRDAVDAAIAEANS